MKLCSTKILQIFSLSWSNEISLHPETLIPLAVTNHIEEPNVLIVSITNMPHSIIKVCSSLTV